MDRQMVLTTTQPVESFMNNMLEFVGFDLAVDIETASVRATDEGSMGILSTEKVDRCVFQTMIAADA
jgi:hypothetical protein